MKEASYYTKQDNSKVRCLLCPHRCLLHDGQGGICRIRVNRSGILYAETYGKISSIHLDPIEKKPLYHFFPGRNILSIGSVGCNLRCCFCQNCSISQVSHEEFPYLEEVAPGKILETQLRSSNSIGIAYTYNEPVIWFEFVMDTARVIRSAGFKNVLVTNGYIEKEPLLQLAGVVDAFSVDLKSFEDSFYKKVTSSSLSPVLDTLITLRAAGKHLEVVNLVIPGLNDDPSLFETMVKWISTELGRETVLHISAYSPGYLSVEPATPASTILKFKKIADDHLDYVYVGNLTEDANITSCPACKNVLIERKGYRTVIQGLTINGECKSCGKVVFQNF